MSHTLLLADDSVTIQRVIELTFADEDVRVVAVSDGDQAIAALGEAPPDIVLADAGMPGKNGYEVAQYIRSTPRLAHIPVVLLTGAFEPVDEARAKAAGCDGVLTKPFEPQLVIGRVKELLANPKRVSASPTPPASEWTEVLDDRAVTRDETRRTSPSATEEYFDRLGVAFANLTDANSAGQEVDAPSLADQIDQQASARSSLASPAPSTTPAISEELIAEVVRRVLDAMSDRVVRETVADTVSKVAERLVREEIERIKSTIK